MNELGDYELWFAVWIMALLATYGVTVITLAVLRFFAWLTSAGKSEHTGDNND